MEPLEKRTWVYLQQPKVYGIPLHSCGHPDPEWSEFKDRLWCPSCLVDFIPEHWGIFDGPVGINICAMLGIFFDRFIFDTNEIEKYNLETGKWEKSVIPAKL